MLRPRTTSATASDQLPSRDLREASARPTTIPDDLEDGEKTRR